nr:generative cell specific-1 paralog [Pleodorina starrii]
MHLCKLDYVVSIAVILFALRASEAIAELLTTGRYEKCIMQDAVPCTSKFVLPLKFPSGRTHDIEQYEFTVECLNSPDGQCPCTCNSFIDEKCSCRDLVSPLRVWLTKSALVASYELAFLQNKFNWKPYEVVMRPNDKVCKDGEFDPNPTCGFYYGPSAAWTPVKDSQGFCCKCNSSLASDRFSWKNQKRTRAILDCDFARDARSAHCLKYDPLWYLAFQLGPSSLQLLNINVTVAIPITSAPSTAITTISKSVTTRNEMLSLSTYTPTATTVSSPRLVYAKLEGGLASNPQPPDLRNQLLVLPEPVSKMTKDILATANNASRTDWMVIDQGMFTMDGKTCDKIGTNFSAFRHQQNGCGRILQSCLSGQLKDLWDADMEHVVNGKVPQYMMTRFQAGDKAELNGDAGPLALALPVTSQTESVVMLTVAADKVLIYNRGVGQVEGLRFCRFSNTTCGRFQPGSPGFINMNVTNTGRLSADLTITVTKCTVNVRPIQPRTLVVDVNQSLAVNPPLDLIVEDAYVDPYFECKVTLYNSLGSIVDSKVLVVGSCIQVCKNTMNVACFVRKGCWANLGIFVAVLLGIVGGSIAGIVLLFWAFRFCARYSSRRAAATTAAAGTYHDSLQQPMPPPPQRMRKSWLVWSNPHSQRYPRDEPILGPLVPQLMGPPLSNNPFYNRYG